MQREDIVLRSLSSILYFIEKECRDYLTIADYIGSDWFTTKESLYKLQELGYVESKFVGEDKVKIRNFKTKSGVLTYTTSTVIGAELASKLGVKFF